MSRAVLLMGRTNPDQESYQLLIETSCFSYVYNGAGDRRKEYQEISDSLAEKFLEALRQLGPVRLDITNGLRINPDTGSPEKVLSLEQSLAQEFVRLVQQKIERLARGSPIPKEN